MTPGLNRTLSDPAPDLCPGCGYDLVELGPSGRCPECGQLFEVELVRGYWRNRFLIRTKDVEPLAVPPCIRKLSRWLWTLIVLPVLALSFAMLCKSPLPLGLLLAVPLVMLVVGCLGTYYLIVAGQRGYRLCVHCGQDMRSHENEANCPRCDQPYDRKLDPIRWLRWCEGHSK